MDETNEKATGTMSVRTENGRFAPGHSGNPTGSRRGWATKARKVLQKILEEPVSEGDERTKLEAFWRAVLSKSIKGDMHAARIIAERILPAAFEADLSLTGMEAVQVLDVVACMGEDYVKAGRLPGAVDEADTL